TIWLDHDFVRGKSCLHETTARESGQHNVAVHHFCPSLTSMMHHQHHGDGSRLKAGVPIAAMFHASPELTIYAVLAYLAVAVKICPRTEQPVVMERLHHWNILIAQCPVNRRRNERKRVVHVHDIGPVALKQGGEITVRVRSPNRAPNKGKA